MTAFVTPVVHIEESGGRSSPIAGVGTSTAAFVGPTRTGPTGGVPSVVTSVAEFERAYGGLDPLAFDGEAATTANHVAHGARAFFQNGGRRLYVARTYAAPAVGDGVARKTITGARGGAIVLTARHPGAMPLRLTFTLRFGESILALDAATGRRRLRGVASFDLLRLTEGGALVGDADGFHWVQRLTRSRVSSRATWGVRDATAGAATPEHLLGDTVDARAVSLSVAVEWMGADGRVSRREQWDGLGTHAGHRRSVLRVLGAVSSGASAELTAPLVLSRKRRGMTAADVARVLLDAARAGSPERGVFDEASCTVTLDGGSDGARPTPAGYAGDDSDPAHPTGLRAIEHLPDVSIVAAPGYSAGGDGDGAARERTAAVARALLDHCERMRHRIAVLDGANGQGTDGVRALRAQLDSSYGALYYPWVRVTDPVTGGELLLPPSGFVAGVYARVDADRGVHQAPANEEVLGATGLEVMLDRTRQDVLNAEGINALRWFAGRGYRVWGARTTSSDPEWKYVNMRRYLVYLECSIDRGTQWVVFEPNDESTWANVRRAVEDFLYGEWRSGRLLGSRPEDAYFVRCDRTTMTQGDLDNGRLVVLVGVAPVKPAEFVIFRIGQWTADRPS